MLESARVEGAPTLSWTTRQFCAAASALFAPPLRGEFVSPLALGGGLALIGHFPAKASAKNDGNALNAAVQRKWLETELWKSFDPAFTFLKRCIEVFGAVMR